MILRRGKARGRRRGQAPSSNVIRASSNWAVVRLIHWVYNVSIVDLIVVASAKYLMDFHDAEKGQLHIVTMDNALWRGTKKIAELPNAYDPTQKADSFHRVFA